MKMISVMAKIANRADNDDLVLRAHADADALGQLYDLYYDRIFRFCLYRLFSREVAEDVTSQVFLAVARAIPGFKGRTESDFRSWLYTIAVNHANSYIRKTSRRKRLLEEATRRMRIKNAGANHQAAEADWPTLYAAISKLKPKQQVIIVLRFFENMEFEQIAKVLKARPSTVRVTLYRILKKLRNNLQEMVDGGA